MNNNDDYKPSQVVWEITLKCNLKCFHCGSSAGKERTNELTTKESLKVCKELAEIGFRGIGLMGGELFLRKDWDIITKEIKDLGMAVSTITNGYFNPDKIIPKLVKLEVDCVTVGFDGTEKMHDQIRGVKGSFQKALVFMREAKKADLLTNAITTLHKKNFNDVNNLTKLILEDEGLDWQIQTAVPMGRFSREFELTEEQVYTLGIFIASLQNKYNKERVVGSHSLGFHSQKIPTLSLYPEWKGCYAGRAVLGIRSDGAVRGCEVLPDEYIEGNVRDRSIVDIWNDPNAFAYNRNFKKEELGPLCIDCEYGETCKGGCMARSTLITGKPHNDPNCFYRIEEKLLK